MLWHDVTAAFSPGPPVQERDLFAGRFDQIKLLVDIVGQRGRHAVVFGERGVGKTSLVNILPLVYGGPTSKINCVRVNASPDDTFDSLWKKIFKRFSYKQGSDTRRIADDYPGVLTPDDIQLELESFGPESTPIIVLDEFDRIQDRTVTTQIADTIKALSDYSVGVTIVIVGVAENVGAIIQGHESITRSLRQVEMPRMSQDELADIIVKRCRLCGITVTGDALWKMTFLSRGLPYYAHLLGMYSARRAIEDRRLEISDRHVDEALTDALVEIDQTIKEKYLTATVTQRSVEALYEPVLLACALAPTDELGRFQQRAVGGPLAKITGREYPAATYAFHMNAFCKSERGAVLVRIGEPRNYRYRFTDPMMQPFSILKGLSERRITDEVADVYATRRQLRLSI